jgi:hypothetical protein
MHLAGSDKYRNLATIATSLMTADVSSAVCCLMEEELSSKLGGFWQYFYLLWQFKEK